MRDLFIFVLPSGGCPNPCSSDTVALAKMAHKDKIHLFKTGTNQMYRFCKAIHIPLQQSRGQEEIPPGNQKKTHKIGPEHTVQLSL